MSESGKDQTLPSGYTLPLKINPISPTLSREGPSQLTTLRFVQHRPPHSASPSRQGAYRRSDRHNQLPSSTRHRSAVRECSLERRTRCSLHTALSTTRIVLHEILRLAL